MKIVCLGDSVTAGYGLLPGESFVELLDRATEDAWISRGIPGDTSGGMLARLERDVLSLRPDAALVMGGDNDILVSGSSARARENMMAMTHQLVHAGIRPVIGIPPRLKDAPGNPWRSFADMEAAGKESLAYLAWLRHFTALFRLRFLDFDQEIGADLSLFQPDGLHPNKEGHRRMAQAVLRSPFLHYPAGQELL